MIIEQASSVGYDLPPPDILQEQVLERVILTEIQLQRADTDRAESFRMSDAEHDHRENCRGTKHRIHRAAQCARCRRHRLPAVPPPVARRRIAAATARTRCDPPDSGVSEREIRNCIEDLESNAVVNSDYNLSHIRLNLSDAATADEIDETLTAANEIYERAARRRGFRATRGTIFGQ